MHVHIAAPIPILQLHYEAVFYPITARLWKFSYAAVTWLGALLDRIQGNVSQHMGSTPKIFFVRHWIMKWCVHSDGSSISFALLWRHNGYDDVSNHQPHHCLLNSLFRCRSKKTSKLRVTGTGEFPAQVASNTEYVSIWWRHYVLQIWQWLHITDS